ncbi:MAG: gldN [Chitinophagaceae bacterium]|nr:gldN [Chitinophagaceae bacterium]
MRQKFFSLLLITAVLSVAVQVNAQRKPQANPRTSTQRSNYGGAPANKPAPNTTSKPAPGTTTPNTTGRSNYSNGNNGATGNNGAAGNTANTNRPRTDTLPIEVVKSTSGGLIDTVKRSLRNDASIERNLVKDRRPLEYENIREDDAVFRVRIWREIDTREKMNQPFRYAATEDNGNQRFISILLRALKEDSVMAFSGEDDRFTTPITPEQAIASFGGGLDTSKKYDMEGNVSGYQVRPKAVDPDSIYKFRIKEEWVFDKESSRMFVRILGIAPVMGFKLSTGETVPNSERPLFWVYYPDLRTALSKAEVYNSKNYGARMTWEELFESRMFSSYITKSTMDNPNDVTLAGYIKDPLFRLLEGENIKEKIFNYEQNLWSY